MSRANLVPVYFLTSTLLIYLRVIESSQAVKGNLAIRVENQNWRQDLLVQIFYNDIKTGTVLLSVDDQYSYIGFAKRSVKLLNLKAIDQVLVLTKFYPFSYLFTE